MAIGFEWSRDIPAPGSSIDSGLSGTASVEFGVSPRRRRRPPRRLRRLRGVAASSSDSKAVANSPFSSLVAETGSAAGSAAGRTASIGGSGAAGLGSGAAAVLPMSGSTWDSASSRLPGRSRRCRSGLGGRLLGLAGRSAPSLAASDWPNRLPHSQRKKLELASGLAASTDGVGAGVAGATPLTAGSSLEPRIVAVGWASNCSSKSSASEYESRCASDSSSMRSRLSLKCGVSNDSLGINMTPTRCRCSMVRIVSRFSLSRKVATLTGS